MQENITLSDEQKDFPNWLLSQPPGIYRLTGHAGSGKTTVMKHLSTYLNRKNTLWACPSHWAKNILLGKLEGQIVSTVASLIGARPTVINGKWEFIPGVSQHKIQDEHKYLIIDESSMLGKDTLSYILNLFNDTNLEYVLFVGDPAQLPPVKERISPIYTNKYQFPTYHLSKVFRQKNPDILNLANDTRETGKNTAKKNNIKCVNALMKSNIIKFYQEYEAGIVLCPTHKIKDYCNKIARGYHGFPKDELFCENEIIFLESPILNGPTNGSRVKITSKPKLTNFSTNQTLKNFQYFQVWEFEVDSQFKILVPYNSDVRKQIEKHLSSLANSYHLEHDKNLRQKINDEVNLIHNKIVFASSGYAMTIHKSQGSTFEHVLLIIREIEPFKNQGIHINMIYTGITRASKTLILGV